MAEQNSILSNTNLSSDEKSAELRRLEMQQAQANNIAAGQDLPPEPPLPPPLRKIYVLGPGDSAATIALMYGLPVSAVIAANPRVNFNKLKPGQAISIPPSPFMRGAGP